MDLLAREDDRVLLTVRNEEKLHSLNVWVYEQEGAADGAGGNAFVSREVPLAVEWLTSPSTGLAGRWKALPHVGGGQGRLLFSGFPPPLPASWIACAAVAGDARSARARRSRERSRGAWRRSSSRHVASASARGQRGPGPTGGVAERTAGGRSRILGVFGSP